jgi:hypothetical protein
MENFYLSPKWICCGIAVTVAAYCYMLSADDEWWKSIDTRSLPTRSDAGIVLVTIIVCIIFWPFLLLGLIIHSIIK